MLRVTLFLLCAGCGAETTTTVAMDYGRPTFLAAPWPSESLRREDGGVVLGGFPDPTGAPIVGRLVEVLERDARGFSTTAGIFFQLTGPVSATEGVFLVPIDTGVPHPIEVRYRDDGGPFGSPHLLSIVPLQGRPLAPRTLHAAVVTRELRDASGAPLRSAPAVETLAAGGTPPGMRESAASRYREALAALAAAGTPSTHIAGLAVFETDAPAESFVRARDAALARPQPALETPFAQTEVFEAFCVYEAALPMPVYQSGEPPFEEDGGGWIFDGDGAPVFQRDELARIVVTLPRAPMPTAGFPVLLFSRTGGGGDRPLVDRGARAEPGGEPIAPGSGPALDLARAGFAGVSVDGPHGGLRNVTGGDEQFLMFNVENPSALRDNVRQSALELTVQAQLLGELRVPAAGCPEIGAAEARFDPRSIALMGHSMGATIAPIAVSADPAFGALVLSGAGGSYIENVIHKQSPLPVRGFAELLLGIAGSWELSEHDPVVSLLQWAVEPADPPVYAIATAHVLMLQGIVDTYILPPMANALSLALGLDLAGASLDAAHPELAAFTPLEALLPHSGGAHVDLPVSASRVAVVVQHPEDGIEDGHEVVFQTEAPKLQYRCFLQTFAGGGAPVVTTGLDDACP